MIDIDLVKQNEELMLKIDSMIGEGRIDELIELGESLKTDTHPSLQMSYLMFRFSWDCPKELEEELSKLMNENCE